MKNSDTGKENEYGETGRPVIY